jgi:hypothetical protein
MATSFPLNRATSILREFPSRARLPPARSHHPARTNHLQALPRLSLSGQLQETPFIKSLLTGLPFLLSNRLPGERQ